MNSWISRDSACTASTSITGRGERTHGDTFSAKAYTRSWTESTIAVDTSEMRCRFFRRRRTTFRIVAASSDTLSSSSVRRSRRCARAETSAASRFDMMEARNSVTSRWTLSRMPSRWRMCASFSASGSSCSATTRRAQARRSRLLSRMNCTSRSAWSHARTGERLVPTLSGLRCGFSSSLCGTSRSMRRAKGFTNGNVITPRRTEKIVSVTAIGAMMPSSTGPLAVSVTASQWGKSAFPSGTRPSRAARARAARTGGR